MYTEEEHHSPHQHKRNRWWQRSDKNEIDSTSSTSSSRMNVFSEWKDHLRASFLTNSTNGSFIDSSSQDSRTNDNDLDSIYTHRSSYSSQHNTDSSSTVTSHHIRMSLPIFEESEERGSLFAQYDAATTEQDAIPNNNSTPLSKMFVSSTIRVWKQTPLPNWMNVFVPRHVSLHSGVHPYLEYRRQEDGPIRQRLYLSANTSLTRLPKNKLCIDFQSTSLSSTDLSSSNIGSGKDKTPITTTETPIKRCCTQDTWILRFENKHDRDAWAKKIQDAIDLLNWINKYTLGQVVMDNDSSTLVEAFSWLDQQDPSYVMKVIKLEEKKVNLRVRNEMRLHHLLTNYSNHPNIVTLQDSYRQSDRAYLIMEYCAGGDLFDYLNENGALSESQAKQLFRYIAKAIAHVHEHRVVHLDIKPENLLFHSSAQNFSSIKLADFGSAQLIAEGTQYTHAVTCTVGYAAPEVLENGKVSFAADVFSAGAVLYTLLCGFAPFQSPSDEEAMERTMCGDYSFDEMEWELVSASAKDLVAGMLEVDPSVRLSMEEVLDHPWLQ